MPAAVVQQQEGETIRIAASVPDIGWTFNHEEVMKRGAVIAKKYFNSLRATVALSGHSGTSSC